VFEVLRQNLLRELIRLIYHEAVPVVVPIYRGVIRGILIIKEVIMLSHLHLRFRKSLPRSLALV
jgi:hypothetical protein